MYPLIEIHPDQVTAKLKAMFDPHIPTSIRCQAVLGGGNAGRIFVDKTEQPHSVYVWEQDDGTLYQGGIRDYQTLHRLVVQLKQEAFVVLGFRDVSEVKNFPPEPDAGAECVELERPPGGSDLAPFLTQPPGFAVHRMGRELLESSPRLDETLHRYGNLESYMGTGLGVCILHGEEFVCEAGADMEVDGIREIGVVTEPKYRGGNGFGTMVTAHLLRWCDELGCSTYWDCVALNIGSLKIARKMGFKNERGYKILAWFPPKKDYRIEYTA